MTSEIRDLRGDIRHWRRGRADVRLRDALSDAYIALFATAMFGSAIVNVVVSVRRVSGEACTARGCLEARTMLPWLTAVAGVVLVLGVARLFGPVFVSPAVGSWLLTTPVDRRSILRPRLVGTALVGAVVSGLLAAGASTLGGFSVPALLAFTGSASLLAIAVICGAALSQAVGGLAARVLLWVLAAAIWGGLLVLALRAGPVAAPPDLGPGWVVGLVAGLIASVALLVVALLRLDRLGRRHVAPGGSLAPGISGALATLDLALAYDVLLGHRWRGHHAVRSRRGGPAGPAVLVWADLTRIRRSPQVVVLLLAAVVVPYAAEAAGAGRVVVLVGTLAGFLVCLPLLAGLRVVTRTTALARAMPFPEQTTRLATLVVPATGMAVFGLGTTVALHGALGATWLQAVGFALTVGLASLAAAVRWVTGRPPDYTKPLVSTPAGGIPTNLYASAVRGFDVLLLATAPLLIWPTPNGAVVSLLVSLGVLSYLVSRE